MTDRAKKITELPVSGTSNTSIANSDLFIVEDVSANTTKSVTFGTIRVALIQGPHADDAAANASGVALGQPYYTSDGSVKVRLV